MQRPTITGIKVRSPADAHVIFHAVFLNLLPIVSRRLDTEERRSITSGCVFVWEERGSNGEATGLGIERWTDSIRWGPSRVKDEFLFYHEKKPDPMELDIPSDSDSNPFSSPGHSRGLFRENLIKQTYSVFVETPRGRRKWHLIAYFTQESAEYLQTIDDIPLLANLHPPPGKYTSARSVKGRPFREQMPYMLAYSPYSVYGRSMVLSPVEPGIRPGSSSSTQSSSGSEGRANSLAPLRYLQNLTPPRRHPFDEEFLLLLNKGLGPKFWDQ